MASCCSSWLLVLREPRQAITTAEAYLQRLQLQVQEKRGEVSPQGGSLIRTLPKKHLDFSEASSCCEFLHLSSLGLLPLLIFRMCPVKSGRMSQYNWIYGWWQMTLSLMGHTRVRRQSVSLYRIQAELWLGPSLSDHVRPKAGHSIPGALAPGTRWVLGRQVNLKLSPPPVWASLHCKGQLPLQLAGPS